MIHTPLLVLAGGFGTRLRGVVADVPKPLAPVAGAPFLKHLGDQWAAQGIRDFVFLLHHDAHKVEEFLNSERKGGFLQGATLRSVVDPSPLGTGGAVAYAVRELGLTGEFLVANADTWLGTGMSAVASSGAPAMAVVRVPDTSRYGQVRVEHGEVVAFEEKREHAGAGWINAGLYLLKAALFAAWDGKPFSLERDLFPSLAKSEQFRAVPVSGDFIDIGVPEDYARFCRWIEGGRREAL